MTADIDEDGRALLDCVRPGLAAELDALLAVETAARKWTASADLADAGDPCGAALMRSDALVEMDAALDALDALESRRG